MICVGKQSLIAKLLTQVSSTVDVLDQLIPNYS